MSYSKILDDGTNIGDVAGIAPGTYFKNRQELHDKGLHLGLMRGIAPHGSSVVLSGGYPDDQDLGDLIIYTGEGGRDPLTSRQTSDQEFSAGNKALAENHLAGVPVRVIRGSKYVKAMPAGFRYRYDGLYRVAQSWIEVGRDGFKICRFRLEKIAEAEFAAVGDAPPEAGVSGTAVYQVPERRESRVTRIVRDTDVSDDVKDLYDFSCQICATRLTTPRGAYAEGAHIKPLGRPHNGPDAKANLLCLCPNCHVLFDEVAIWIDDDLSIRGARTGALRTTKGHVVDVAFLQYHRAMGGH